MLAGETQRCDLPAGTVPDYRTFKRHLWSYRDPAGFQIMPPPVMYLAVFEAADSEDIGEIAEYVIDDLDDDSVEMGWVASDITGGGALELRFRTLEALHVFCLTLGELACGEREAWRRGISDTALCVGQFIMWTLGFRWV